MFTSLNREELVKVGKRLHPQRMLDQAQYTLKLAAQDAPVAAALGKEFMAVALSAVQKLDAALDARAVAISEGGAATVRERAAQAQAMVWRRACVNRMKIALKQGVDIPAHATRVGTKHPNSGKLATDLERLVQAVADHQQALAAVGLTPEFAKKGADLARRLKQMDQEQETYLRAQRRDATANVREAAGLAWFVVTEIHDMGRSVHADDRVKASQYNMRIARRDLPTAAPPDVGSSSGPPPAAAASA